MTVQYYYNCSHIAVTCGGRIIVQIFACACTIIVHLAYILQYTVTVLNELISYAMHLQAYILQDKLAAYKKVNV